MPEHVDYGRAAATYDRGRALRDHALDAWRDAVLVRLRDEHDRLVVLDLGSGTGLFSGAWRRWGARVVLAVEPSADMRAKALARSEPGVHSIAGTATNIPLRNASADVAWLSAVVHHIERFDEAATELHRVLRPGGRVMIRGYVPDMSDLPWLEHFPGADRARSRFPRSVPLAKVMEAAGFDFVRGENVRDPERHSRAAAADWVEMMRDADSILTALTDDEIAAGTSSLRGQPEELLDPIALTLLTFRLPP